MAETMTLRQLAEYLQMSIDSVYHLVRRGKIPGVKIGKQWRFSKTAIDRWLAGTSGRTARVLVVEDDGILCRTILDALHSRGHHAVGVENSDEAALLLGQVTFDTVLVDLSLRDKTASLIIQRVLELPSRPDILVFSGFEDSGILESIKQMMRYVTVLHKPLDLDSLVELVELRRAER